MNRIKYENYLGAAGYDAVARKKIKELEEKGVGGGGGMFVVTVTPTGSTTATLDKTYQEIQTAYDSGMWIVAKVVGAPMLLTLQTTVTGMPALFAHYMPAPNGTITFNTLGVYPDDTVELSSYIVEATNQN